MISRKPWLCHGLLAPQRGREEEEEGRKEGRIPELSRGRKRVIVMVKHSIMMTPSVSLCILLGPLSITMVTPSVLMPCIYQIQPLPTPILHTDEKSDQKWIQTQMCSLCK